MRKITVNQPEPTFQPVTLVIESKTELANILGALVAYGQGKVYAEEGLKAIGLGDYYSGVVPLPEFSAYLGSSKFRSSHPSTAGAKVLGTGEDLAPGRSKTTFEAA
jgi:hypothetical protein